jgi:hypothetical protein
LPKPPAVGCNSFAQSVRVQRAATTWHHFFNISLTGDRHLETITVAPHQQKLHGF